VWRRGLVDHQHADRVRDRYNRRSHHPAHVERSDHDRRSGDDHLYFRFTLHYYRASR
jgi:hypothetical protein